MTPFEQRLAEFRGAQAPTPKRVVPPSRGARLSLEEALNPLTYAVPQPLLCADFPHHFMPVHKSYPVCVRCGTRG